MDADFGFTGFYYHAVSGLYLALYREYSADLGRWLSRDPSGETSGLNLYAYVANNPINAIDLYGTDQTTGNTIEGLGLGYGAVELSPAAAWTIGINNASGSISVYTSGWSTGNGSVSIAGSVGTFAKFTGTSLTVVGAGYNLYEAYNGQQSWGEAGVNIGVSGTAWGIGTFAEGGGPIGWSLAGGYLGGNLLGNWTPYQYGGTINENVSQEFVPFWNWWYGYQNPSYPLYIPPCK